MPLTGAHGDKRYVFFVNTCAFYSAVASNQRALTPAICRYIFCRCRPRPHHVLAWFRTRGWSARHCHFCRWRRGGRGKYLVGTIHRYIIEYSLDKLILREKNIIHIIMCSCTISHCGDGFGRFEVSLLTMWEKTLRILSSNRQIWTFINIGISTRNFIFWHTQFNMKLTLWLHNESRLKVLGRHIVRYAQPFTFIQWHLSL